MQPAAGAFTSWVGLYSTCLQGHFFPTRLQSDVHVQEMIRRKPTQGKILSLGLSVGGILILDLEILPF